MVGIAVGASLFLEPGSGGDIDLLADDRIDVRGPGLQIELNGAVHHPVVGESDRRHAGLGRQANHVRDPAGAIEQAEFRVRVEVDEAHATRSSRTTLSMW